MFVTLVLLALGQVGHSTLECPDLTWQAPYACPDLLHFPSDRVLYAQNDFNSTFMEWAKVQASLGGWHADFYQEQVDEASGWYQRYLALLKTREKWVVYHAAIESKDFSARLILSSQNEYYYSLEYLQWFIGPEAFSLGTIGPPIPWWFFAK